MEIISKLEEQVGQSALIASEMRIKRAELFPEGIEWDSSKFDS